MSERRDDDDGDGDDVELLRAWAGGNRDAGADLFDRHYDSIERFFRYKVNETVQGDLIHETFAAVLKAAPRFRAEARFRTFLFTVARNVLIDHLRKQRPAARHDEERDVDEIPAADHDSTPIANAVRREEHRLLLEALRRIPLIHQIALELHYWEYLTAAEIGEVLQVPLGTAKTRLRDGRICLERQLEKIARSPESLRSTLDSLKTWAQRVRALAARLSSTDEKRTPEPGTV